MMTDLVVQRGAEISPCGRYRYCLWRTWDVDKPRLAFVMLNPSTADGQIDDPTIRVCMGRAHRMGYGGIHVLNLFAWRATHPEELRKVEDPVGPENDRFLERYLALSYFGRKTIAAWGDGGLQIGREQPRWREALKMICHDLGHEVLSLGLTKAGQPKHPLRIAYSVEPTLWMDRERFLKVAS